jgi:hypothetical protein
MYINHGSSSSAVGFKALASTTYVPRLLRPSNSKLRQISGRLKAISATEREHAARSHCNLVAIYFFSSAASFYAAIISMALSKHI